MKERLTLAACLPVDRGQATLVARVFVPGQGGPSPALVRDDALFDVSSVAPTVQALLELDDPVAAMRSGARVAAHRRARRGPRQLVGARARRREAVAPRAVRPSGDQGERRHVRLQHARARDRGAGARRPGEGRGGAQIDRRRHRRQSLRGEAGLAGGRAAEGRADRAARVVAVPRGRHRPGCRDLHEGATDVGDRHRRRRRPASEVGMEQPRARDRARREQPRAHASARRSATT